MWRWILNHAEDEKIAVGTVKEKHSGLAEPQNVEMTDQLVNIDSDPDIDPELDTDIEREAQKRHAT